MNEAVRGLPPPDVAPPKEQRPPTTVDLFREAKTEINPALAKWVFRRAKASGKRAVAEAKLRRLEMKQLTVESKAAAMPSDAAMEMVMANGVSDIEFQSVEIDLADAVEQQTAAEGVIAALSRKEKP